MAYGRKSRSSLDIEEVGRRIIKYLIEGVMVALAAYFIPARGKNGKSPLEWEDVLVIGLTAAATFALLDLYAPSIGSTARQGAGFGIGAGLVGWPGGAAIR
jgi:hypothetical protein